MYSKRIQKARKVLKEQKVDAIWSSDPITIFYLTGLDFSAGVLLLKADNALLFVDGRYFTIAQEKSPCPVFLHTEDNMKNAFSHSMRVVFDSSIFNYQAWQNLNRSFEKWEKAQNISLHLVPIFAPFQMIRFIKEEEEILSLKRSAELNQKGFYHLLSLLREGIEEKELAREFAIFCLKNGADGLSFDPIIAFGVNTCYPHHKSGQAKLKKNDIVLMDLGVTLNHYCSDMTRTFFFKEKDPELNRIYSVVEKAQKKALRLCKPGIFIGDLDKAAREEMKKSNLEAFFPHSLGHGIGLEIHEYPRIKWDSESRDIVLECGMVFTVEPGIYLPEKGGVRYEDTIVITEHGYDNFYKDLQIYESK